MKKTKEFLELQRKWYKKLKKSGFDDIEWINHDNGAGQNKSPYIKKHSFLIFKAYKSQTETFYRNCSNYLITGTFASKIQQNLLEMYFNGSEIQDIAKYYKRFAAQHKITTEYLKDLIYKFLNFEILYLTDRDKQIFKLFADGMSYRQISKRLKTHPKSIFYIHRVLKRLIYDVHVYNHTNPEGLQCYKDPLRPIDVE